MATIGRRETAWDRLLIFLKIKKRKRFKAITLLNLAQHAAGEKYIKDEIARVLNQTNLLFSGADFIIDMDEKKDNEYNEEQ